MSLKLEDLKNKHLGEEMIVVGNGEGLKNIPFAFLESRPNFVINYFSAHVPFIKPDYWLALDPLCFSGATYAKDSIKLVKGYHAHQFSKFVDDNLVFYTMQDRIPGFDWSSEWGLKYSTTAIAALHLAYYMGAAKALLVGIDCTMGMGMYEDLENFKGISRIPHFYDPRHHFTGYADQWDKDFGLFYGWVSGRGMEIVNLSVPTLCETLPKGDYREYWSPELVMEAV